MSQSREERVPDGSQETESVELGDPARIDQETRESLEDQPRPNLDRREERISTTRKPMGPPLETGTPSFDETPPPENTEGPTDPS